MTPERMVYEKLRVLAPALESHEAQAIGIIEQYSLMLMRDEGHRLISSRAAIRLMQEAAECCPQANCPIRAAAKEPRPT